MAAVAVDFIVREEWLDKLPKTAVEFYDEVIEQEFDNVLDDNGKKTDVCYVMIIYSTLSFHQTAQYLYLVFYLTIDRSIYFQIIINILLDG